MNISEFKERASAYGRALRMLPWLIGDLMLSFERDNGEKAHQYFDVFGASPRVLQDFMWVAETFPEDKRLDYRLPFGYYRDVASLGPERAVALLTEALNEGYTSKELREVKKESRWHR